MIEKVLHRIEDHVEEWRKHERARQAETEAHREKLWAEAAHRQKLLAEAIAGEEEAGRSSLEEITKEHRIAFVLHREDLSGTLKDFAKNKDRLVKVIPGKGTTGEGRASRA